MDLVIQTGIFLLTAVITGLTFLKIVDKKFVTIENKVNKNDIDITKLNVEVDAMKINMWKHKDLEKLIKEVSSETVKLAITEFKLELSELGVGRNRRTNSIVED